MKKILLFLLPFFAMAQNPTNFPYGIKNTVAPTVTTPTYFVTQEANGIHNKTASALIAKITDLDKKQGLSTGLIKNGAISINADPTKYNISAGIGVITNYDNPEIPTCTIVNFAATTGKTPTYLTSGNITYVAINSSGVIVEQATQFTTSQRRDLIILGAVIHSNLTTINVVNNISAPTNADTNQLHDLMSYIGALNLTGNKYTANGANLSLDKSAGSIFKPGVNFANDWKKPHELDESLQTLLTFRYRTQTGVEGSDVTVLNPALYDLAGTLTTVPSNKFTIQTVTMFQTGLTRIQYGQNIYNSLAEAENAILTRAFVVESNIAMNGITRSYIILRNSTTSLQNTSDAKIVEAQKFGGVASGGVALTDTAIIAALGYTPENIANKSNTLVSDGTATKYYTADYINSKLSINYAKIVYVNATNPNSATIFDLNNPPVTNDNALKTDTNNLYIATDASTWIWDSGLANYVTKTLAATSNFYLEGSTADAGSNKDADIYRTGSVRSALTVYKVSSNKTLSNTDNGTIILLTASATITLPNGLMNGFNCSFSTLAGVTLTYSLGGSVVLLNNLGTTMAEKLSHTIVNTGVANEYLTAGSL